MKWLAIELSSDQGSVALIENHEVLHEVRWRDTPRLAQEVFTVTPRLLNEHGWALDHIDGIAVGRGPGSYTGLRIAISYAQGLAAPGAPRLYAVQSAEALAAEIAEDHDAPLIVVLGDARRRFVWVRRFERDSATRQVRFLGADMVPVGEMKDQLAPNSLVVTPDWTRLQVLANSAVSPARWIKENCYPRAAYVGLLAEARTLAGVPPEPLLPIYTHPPVTVTAPETKHTT